MKGRFSWLWPHMKEAAGRARLPAASSCASTTSCCYQGRVNGTVGHHPEVAPFAGPSLVSGYLSGRR